MTGNELIDQLKRNYTKEQLDLPIVVSLDDESTVKVVGTMLGQSGDFDEEKMDYINKIPAIAVQCEWPD